MDEDQAADQATLFPKSAGERLREAREAQGLTLIDVANRTRIPIRHLEAIEESRFDTLPSPTYAIGFAKTYARAVGLDETAIASEIRANPHLPLPPSADRDLEDLSDPRRLPSRGVAMVAGIIALLLLAGVGLWYGSGLFHGSTDTSVPIVPEDAPTDTPTATAEAAPAPVTGGQVTLTATDSVWLRVYDGTGKTLYEKTMLPGDRYDVPADANNPMINVGRPDKLQVTLNGSAVAPLGDGKVAIKDIPISGAAIAARANGAPAPAATAAATAPAVTPPVATTPSPVPTATPSSSVGVAPLFREPAPKPKATHRPRPVRSPRAEPSRQPADTARKPIDLLAPVGRPTDTP
jgi:transcriptional regulator with XRE-family HTH domain